MSDVFSRAECHDVPEFYARILVMDNRAESAEFSFEAF